MNAGQPYLATDGKWYYPDGRPYNAATPAQPTGQPYLATDGKWYYPDGRPYIGETVAQPVAPNTPVATNPTNAASSPAAPERSSVTPVPDVIPDHARSQAVAQNVVRTRLSPVPPPIREKFIQDVAQAIQERYNLVENDLRSVLFSKADEAALLAVYKKSFTEDTAQYELTRKLISAREADDLANRLRVDQIVDARVPLYVAKLRMSATLKAFRDAVLEPASEAVLDQSEKALVESYRRIAEDPRFESLKVPGIDQLTVSFAPLRSLLEVRERLVAAQSKVLESQITMARRFRVVTYAGLSKETIYALDPELCLLGTGSGAINVREAGLPDLGVPLLNRPAESLPEVSAPPAPSGAIVYNSKASSAAVHYVVDNEAFDLNPGDSRTHKVSPSSRISYDQGANLGKQKYQLSAGTFRFDYADKAWQLTKPTVAVLIDNSANGSEFQCNIDGQQRIILARTTLEVRSDYPIVIRFDRGEGQATSCKLIEESSQVTVAVRPGSTAIDLFLGSSQDLCVQPQTPADSVVTLPKS